MKKTLVGAFLLSVSLVRVFPSSLPQQQPMFDRFENINCEEEKARLDAFTLQIQNQPEATGYIIYYGGKKYGKTGQLRLPRRFEAEARVARLKDYLVQTRGLSATRLVVINGGYRETWQAELYVVQAGAAAPVATPTLKREQIKFRKGTARAKDYECGV